MRRGPRRPGKPWERGGCLRAAGKESERPVKKVASRAHTGEQQGNQSVRKRCPCEKDRDAEARRRRTNRTATTTRRSAAVCLMSMASRSTVRRRVACRGPMHSRSESPGDKRNRWPQRAPLPGVEHREEEGGRPEPVHRPERTRFVEQRGMCGERRGDRDDANRVRGDPEHGEGARQQFHQRRCVNELDVAIEEQAGEIRYPGVVTSGQAVTRSCQAIARWTERAPSVKRSGRPPGGAAVRAGLPRPSISQEHPILFSSTGVLLPR